MLRSATLHASVDQKLFLQGYALMHRLLSMIRPNQSHSYAQISSSPRPSHPSDGGEGETGAAVQALNAREPFWRILCLLCCFWGFASAVHATGGFLQIRDGYFWDPQTADYFVARGMAYQTWNPPVGADQNFAQLDYDLVEFKKMHANSVRLEMVWNVIEAPHGVFDWSKPDHLLAKADELGLKLFVLIGFQYAPDWFPNDWKAVNDLGSNSVVLNYEHPQARLAYSNYIYQVTSRYKNNTAIGGWILGNEYAYFDLWNPDHRFLGYDAYSRASFRSYLSNTYAGNITALNSNWVTAYPNFSAVAMPTRYPPDRHNPGFHDLIQWRKKSIGDYVAFGAGAARLADPNHLFTYSMVGGIFSGVDAENTCEDAKTIVARCAAAGAPLQFWSINNYAWPIIGNEMRTGDFGIRKYQAQSGLPVMISETGHSSTENFLPGAAPRQPKAIPSQMWEALTSGAIGMHVFTWNDRNLYTNTYFVREEGFGIVNQNRLVKDPVYWNVVEAFRRMEGLNANDLFGGSANAPKDIQYFWSVDSDMGWNRANMENAMLWGALKRLGYQPGIIDDAQFDRGDYTNAPALMLSRCYQMSSAHLDRLTNVVAAGVHVHANADLPGQFDAYNRPNPAWTARMSTLFGLNVAGAIPDFDSGATNLAYTYLTPHGLGTLGPFTPAYSQQMSTWKIWRGLTASSGTTILTHKGSFDLLPGTVPALQIKTPGPGKTAINTFALGDMDVTSGAVPPRDYWNIHHDWLRAIYRDHFGIVPKIDITNSTQEFVYTDYRICRNGSILLSLLNEDTNTVTIAVNAPALLGGKTVENLTTGGILATNSNGALMLTLAGDDYVLLYAYTSAAGVDASIVDSNPNKLWFASAPAAVWPNGPGYAATVGYDTQDTNLNLIVSFERSLFPARTYSQSAPMAVGGKGTIALSIPIPDADLNDPDYVSSFDGGEYILRARLEKGGVDIGDTFLPVRLLWGVRPLTLPTPVLANHNYQVALEWQELPSFDPSQFPTPLDRAALWQSLLAQPLSYEVILELRTNGVAAASDVFVTSHGTTNHQFSITVPGGAAPPFTWFAYLRPSPLSSGDLTDSFENHDGGELVDLRNLDPNAPSPLLPWISYNYPSGGNQLWFNEGVGTNNPGDIAAHGRLSAFLVVTNPPYAPGLNYSGFGITYSNAALWALPDDSRLWTNYTFTCDFKESSGHACIVELQLDDAYGGQIHFTNRYLAGPGGWQTIRASLDQFTINGDVAGFFTRGSIQKLAINVQMLQTNVTYVAFFDNILFTGPTIAPLAVSSHDVIESFEDRKPGLDMAPPNFLSLPWVPYLYSDPTGPQSAGNNGTGIQTFGSEGSQSVFEVVTNPPNPGAYSGFGLSYAFTNSWALPASQSQWSNYVFSFDFNENGGHRCVLELQVKSSPNNWMSFTKTYAPSPSQWDTVRASLDKFVTGPNGPLDPANIQALVVNIQMLDKGVQYNGSFDNNRFDGPDVALPPDLRYGVYDSSNDSLVDSDGDGIPDVYETGTGIYVSPTNTGTNPHNPDSDGDGISDRYEIIAGTNPNLASDVFHIQRIRRNPDGTVVLSWQGLTNKVYGIDYFDGNPFAGVQFFPLPGMIDLRPATNGLFEPIDLSAPASGLRFYRITVRPP